MSVFQSHLSIRSRGKGMQDITDEIREVLRSSTVSTGTAHVFCQHTSCSLVIMENADPSARHDLEGWMERLVPENDPHFDHTAEGPDDMPSHIKMALTRTSEVIPVGEGELLLGTWQGLFLWEHRASLHTRRLVVTIQGE